MFVPFSSRPARHFFRDCVVWFRGQAPFYFIFSWRLYRPATSGGPGKEERKKRATQLRPRFVPATWPPERPSATCLLVVEGVIWHWTEGVVRHRLVENAWGPLYGREMKVPLLFDRRPPSRDPADCGKGAAVVSDRFPNDTKKRKRSNSSRRSQLRKLVPACRKCVTVNEPPHSPAVCCLIFRVWTICCSFQSVPRF